MKIINVRRYANSRIFNHGKPKTIVWQVVALSEEKERQNAEYFAKMTNSKIIMGTILTKHEKEIKYRKYYGGKIPIKTESKKTYLKSFYIIPNEVVDNGGLANFRVPTIQYD